LLGVSLPANADPIKFARYPHSSNGHIAFSYHGDIWVADDDGGNARRLTAHVANDTFPRFSPDGQWIAFTSNRMGNNDVFVVPTAGGVPRQVTFHTTNDTVQYWTPDGERIIFSTSRGTHAFFTPLYSVSRMGDLPVPMDMDQGAAGMISQDGSTVAFNRYGMRYWRKGYRGNSNTDIWLQDLASKEITQLTDADTEAFRRHTQDAYPMWGADGMVYFMSERDGIFNIWTIGADGSGLAQVTDHGSDGVQYPSMSPDGTTITYENEFEVWKLSVPGGTPERLSINLDFDAKTNMVEYLTAESQADGFYPSPEGRYLAVDYHGEIFIVPTDPEVGEKKQITASGWRQRSAVWSPDGERLAYISDESGDQEVWVYEVASAAKTRLSDHESEKGRPIWASDSSKLAYSAFNSLFVADVASGEVTEVGTNPERGFQIGNFSADGSWLVYSRRNEDLDPEVYLFEIATRTEHNVTQDPFSDSGGLITADGKHVVFRSNRAGGTNQLFKVSLVRLTEDPDDPLVKERNLLAAEESGGRGGRGQRDEADEEPGTEPITVDTDGIQRRAVQLTNGGNGVGTVFLSNNGETIYFTGRDERGAALFSISLDGGEPNRLAGGGFGGVTPTADGSMVFFRQGGGGGRGGRGGFGGGGTGPVMMMPLRGGNLQNRQEQVSFEFTVTVDKQTEWRQIFDESWRVMKYRFYDAEMHGVDWSSVRERYEGLLQYVGQNQDLYDLTNEMIGELNASHTGVSGPSGIDQPETYGTADLGFEIAPAGNAYVVDHVYKDGPVDKEWIDIQPGDTVVSIDHQRVRPPRNYWQILNHTLNDYVTVTIDPSTRTEAGRVAAGAAAGAANADPGESHEIRIRTVGSLRNIKYEEWVESNREYVEEVSDGQIAYVHIRSMNQASLVRFENEIDRFWNAKGIVVDIRYNGGGNIDQQLIDILERRPYEFWNNRYASEQSGRRPRQAIAGPKVMLINRRSGSDSEVTPMGFRDLGLGHIVGTPTSGAVIATGSYRLINGGSIRTPGSLVVTYDPTQPGNRGVNLENYGVAPDVWVENSPQDELDGFDRELKEAVDEALRMLASGEWQYRGTGRDGR
jgi:tricorn protease